MSSWTFFVPQGSADPIAASPEFCWNEGGEYNPLYALFTDHGKCTEYYVSSGGNVCERQRDANTPDAWTHYECYTPRVPTMPQGPEPSWPKPGPMPDPEEPELPGGPSAGCAYGGRAERATSTEGQANVRPIPDLVLPKAYLCPTSLL